MVVGMRLSDAVWIGDLIRRNGGRRFPCVPPSIGTALHSRDGLTIKCLVSEAGLAMQHAK